MSPSDSNTNMNAAVEQIAGTVSGTGAPSNSDLCDWSQGHIVTEVDWPFLLLNDAIIITGVGIVVWLIMRKQKSR